MGWLKSIQKEDEQYNHKLTLNFIQQEHPFYVGIAIVEVESMQGNCIPNPNVCPFQMRKWSYANMKYYKKENGN